MHRGGVQPGPSGGLGDHPVKLVTVNETTAFNPEQVVMVTSTDTGCAVLLANHAGLNVDGVEPMHLVAQINEALK